MKEKIYFLLGFLLGFLLIGLAATQSCPLSGQYHPLSEICVDTDLDMQGKNIVNIGKLGIGTSTPAEKLDVVGNIKVSGTIIHSDSGILWQTDNGHVRITFHDGCGNFQIMAGAQGCPNTYVQNSGAAEIEMQYDFGANGAIFLRVAPAGTAGNTISWVAYSFKTDEFDSPKQIKAPKIVDRDNNGYYIDPSGVSNINTLIVNNNLKVKAGYKLCLDENCQAYMYYDPTTQTLYISAPNITFIGNVSVISS